jgi:FdhE protein
VESLKDLNGAICGEDRQCLDELESLSQLLREIDEIARGFELEAAEGPPPLITNLADVERAKHAAAARVPANFADYLIRRALYFRYGGGEWNGRCKVCGAPASLVVLAREKTGIFEGYRAYARCVCGSAWPFEAWKCPSCGAAGRENFEVYALKEGRLLRCARCGYLFGEVEEGPDLQAIHVKFALLIAKLRG